MKGRPQVESNRRYQQICLRLQEIQNEINVSKDNKEPLTKEDEGSHLQLLGDIVEEEIPEECLVRLPSLVEEEVEAPKIFVLPGIEGSAKSLKALARNLPGHVFCFQYISEAVKDTIGEMARNVFEVKNLNKASGFKSQVLLALAEAYCSRGRVLHCSSLLWLYNCCGAACDSSKQWL